MAHDFPGRSREMWKERPIRNVTTADSINARVVGSGNDSGAFNETHRDNWSPAAIYTEWKRISRTVTSARGDRCDKCNYLRSIKNTWRRNFLPSRLDWNHIDRGGFSGLLEFKRDYRNMFSTLSLKLFCVGGIIFWGVDLSISEVLMCLWDTCWGCVIRKFVGEVFRLWMVRFNWRLV